MLLEKLMVSTGVFAKTLKIEMFRKRIEVEGLRNDQHRYAGRLLQVRQTTATGRV